MPRLLRALVRCAARVSAHLAADEHRRGVVLGARVDLGARLAQQLRAAERASASRGVKRRRARVVASHALLDEGHLRTPLARGCGARDEHAQLVPAEAGGLYGVEHHDRALGPIEQAAEEERRPVRCNGARADQDAVRCNRAQQIRTRCSGFEPLASMPADGVGLAQVGPSRDELLCEAGLATRTADMQRSLQVRPALDIE